MSIPHICPSCGNHISTAHAEDCCYGTPQYAHLGWPEKWSVMVAPAHATPTMEELSKDGYPDTASAIRRLLEYLEEEPEPNFGRENLPSVNLSKKAILLLTEHAEKLRKEAAGIYNVEARAKRNFAADYLDGIIQEMSE